MMKQFGQRMRELREHHKVSPTKLAEICGVKDHAYRRWERGETRMYLDQAASLAEFYQCTLDELISPTGAGAHVVNVEVDPGQEVRVALKVTATEIRPNAARVEFGGYQTPVKMKNAKKAPSKARKRKATAIK